MMVTDQEEWKPLVQRMLADIEEAFKDLQSTWQDIGFSSDVRSKYYDQAYEHINGLLVEMTAEARSRRQELADNIRDLLEQTALLLAELHLDTIPQTYHQDPLCKVQELLQADLQNLKRMKKDRTTIMKELMAKEQDLCRKLGCKPLIIDDNGLLSEQELESFKLYLQKQEIEKIRLENVFTDIRHSILKMMDDLELSPSSPFQELICNNLEEFVLSSSNMTKLREFRDELTVEVENAKCRVENLKENLLALWKYLDEPNDVCQSFLDRYPGYNTSTINAFRAEIDRCKEKRKANISQYVAQIREELLDLWDLCKYCEAERNAFVAFECETFTEDLLTLHELELEKLRKFYNNNQTIFDLLDQRENLITKIKEMLKRANNPDRYHNRGCQLLTEEKERKAIQKKLPKIEKQLEQLINEYETKHNRTFTIYGMSLENVILETWESLNLERETIKRARKEAKDKLVKKSPLNSSKRTPGMAHLSIPRPVHGLSKRKLFTPSPNSSIKRKNKNGDKNKPTVTASKIRRSGRVAKMQKPGRSSRGGQQKRESLSSANSIMDGSYSQFQGHMTDREELHSSMLPEQVLRSANKININKTPVRTPMKPLRKHLAVTTTPVAPGSARKLPHSPRVVNAPKLATAPTNLPFIF